MHEFKHGQLDSSSGRKVKNPRQAIAIALHEAGASRDETPAGNRRNLASTKAKERQAGAGRKERGGKPVAGTVAEDGREKTRAVLYEEATKRGIAGRSRMTKAQLARALGR